MEVVRGTFPVLGAKTIPGGDTLLMFLAGFRIMIASSSLRVSLGLCSLTVLASASEPLVRTAHNPAELVALAPALRGDDGAVDSPLIVRIAAGTYELEDSIRILRSHVRIEGEPGAKLVLASGVNEPVIAIGTQDEVPAEDAMLTNISITGLEIDGRKDGQASETSYVRPWIRNNGIDVRAVTGLTVENVLIANARSGGLVISYRCRDVVVRHGTFSHNYFDGLAFYDSERVTVADCVLNDNHAAGVSLDNNFRDSVFVRCTIRHNGDVGIFARHTHGVRFESCIIEGSGNWAAFLGHDEMDQGVSGIQIASGQIRGNRGGVFLSSLNEQQSSAVDIESTTFASNLVDGRANWVTCGAPLVVANATELPSAESGSVLPIATVPATAW